jgi:hypothetical protein
VGQEDEQKPDGQDKQIAELEEAFHTGLSLWIPVFGPWMNAAR